MAILFQAWIVRKLFLNIIFIIMQLDQALLEWLYGVILHVNNFLNFFLENY